MFSIAGDQPMRVPVIELWLWKFQKLGQRFLGTADSASKCELREVVRKQTVDVIQLSGGYRFL